MSGGVVTGALKREELVNRRDRHRVGAPDADFPTARALDDFVRDRRAARLHDGRPGDRLRVDLEGFGEVAGLERGGDVAHVQTNGRDAARVRRAVPIEHDASAIGQVFEDVGGGVLVDPHHHPAALLHGGEIGVPRPAGREYERQRQ